MEAKKIKHNGKAYDLERPIRHKFYKTTAGKKKRDDYYNKMMGLCERCKRDKHVYETGVIVHHKQYITDHDFITYNTKVLLADDNLELLCMKCHNKEHNREAAVKPGSWFDENGNYIIEIIEEK